MTEFIVIKNFVTDDIIDYYLNLSLNHTEQDSKVGTRVAADKKIRKDIFFNGRESSMLDKVIFNSKHKFIKDTFGIDIKYRETYKLGTYYGDNKGFYIPHTDTQGGKDHRKLSFVICLTDKSEYEGGLLNIVTLGEKIKFTKGDAIIFNANLLHGVEPVTSGKRQVLISFTWDEAGETLRKQNSTIPTTTYVPKI